MELRQIPPNNSLRSNSAAMEAEAKHRQYAATTDGSAAMADVKVTGGGVGHALRAPARIAASLVQALFAASSDTALGASQVHPILRNANNGRLPRHGGNRRHVSWPSIVAYADDVEHKDEAAREAAAVRKTERRRYMSAAFHAIAVTMMTYEVFAIPMRAVLPMALLATSAGIALDVCVDLYKLCALYQETRAQHKAKLLDQTQGWRERMRARRLLVERIIDLAGIGLLHFTRILFLATHETLPFQLTQIIRLPRVFQLMQYTRNVSNDMSTDLRYIALFKFLLVLLTVPHWTACAWWLAKETLVDNHQFDPASSDGWGEYLLMLHLSWAGLATVGYGNLLVYTHSEMILAAIVSAVAIAYYSFTLGTLFHYIARKDSSLLHYEELMRAVDMYAIERNLPLELTARLKAHFNFQHRKVSDAGVSGQMPLSLRTEVAVEQYSRHVSAAWVFFGASPQFVNHTVLFLREWHLMPGQTVFKRGDGATDLLWCLSGALHVVKGDAVISTVRADIGPGQVVGAIAYFVGFPQPASVVASSSMEVTVAALSSKAYDEVLAAFPEQAQTPMINILRHFGLNSKGENLSTTSPAAGGLDVGAMDDDERAEYEAQREMVRKSIIDSNQERHGQLLYAVATADADTVRHIVSRGFDVNSQQYDGRCALHLAAKMGNEQMVKLLCELGAEVNIKDRFGTTPMREAVNGKHAKAAEALARAGGVLVFEHAASRLHAAAWQGDVEQLAVIMSHGVDVNFVNYDGRSVLHVAATSGDVRLASWLLSSLADVSIRDRFGHTPLDDAIVRGNFVVAQQLLKWSAAPSADLLSRKLHEVAARGDADELKLAVQAGARNLDAQDYSGRTALHSAVASKSKTAVQLLVAAMADVRVADTWGRTPLVDALASGELDIAALLVHMGGATLPEQWSTPGSELAEAMERARSRDMLSISDGIRSSIFRRLDSRKLVETFEVDIGASLGGLIRDLRALGHAHAAIYRTVRRQAEVWINEYAVEEEEDNDNMSSSDGSASEDSSESADEAAAADKNADFQKAFLRVAMHLADAEAGLVCLRAIFRARLVPRSFHHLSERDRREQEAEELRAILRDDLDIEASVAERIIGEVYAELALLFGSSANAKEGHANISFPSLRGPGEAGANEFVRKGSENGSSLAALKKATSEHDVLRAQRARLVGLRDALGLETEGGVGEDPGSPGYDDDRSEPVHLSDLGHAVVFCSRSFVEYLASERKQTDPEGRGAAQANASGRSDASQAVSVETPVDSPPAQRRSLLPASLNMSLDGKRTFKGAAGDHTQDASGINAHHDVARRVSAAARIILDMFRLFDRRHAGVLRVRDLHELGRHRGAEFAEIDTLVAFVCDTARSLSPVYALQHEDQGAPRSNSAQLARAAARPGPFDHIEGAPAAGDMAAPRPEESARTLRRGSSALVKGTDGAIVKPKLVGDISAPHFFIALTSWILLSAEDQDEDESDDAAHVAPSSTESPVKKLRLAGGVASMGSLKDVNRDGDVRPAGFAKRIDAPVDAKEDIDKLLGTPTAHVALARAVSQRLASERLLEDDVVDWEVVRGIAAQVFTLPADTTAVHIRDWGATALDITQDSDDIPSHNPFAMGDESDGPVTWSGLVQRLHATAAAAQAESSGAVARFKTNAPGHAQEAGMVRGGAAKKPWFIVSERSASWRTVHGIFLLSTIINFIMLPIEFAFVVQKLGDDPQFAVIHEQYSTAGHVTTACALFRMCLRFVTTYVNSDSVEVTSPSAIRQNYLKGQFFLDLIAAWPEDYIAAASGASPKVYASLRFLRLINLRYTYAASKRLADYVGKGNVLGNIAMRLVPLLATTHVLACVWEVVMTSERHREMSIVWDDPLEDDKGDIDTEANYHRGDEADVLSEYFTAYLRWLTMGIFTLPANVGELIFIICVFACQLILYAWTVGGVSRIVMSKDDDIIAKRAQLELVNAYIRHLSVPAELKQRMRGYFIDRIQTTASLSAITSEDIYSQLPVALQMDVAAITSRPLVGAAPLFQECSAGFMNRLAAMLTERLIDPETSVFRVGEACSELLLVASGFVEMFVDADDLNSVEVKGRGSELGAVPFAFGIKHIRNARVAKGSRCMVFALSSGAYRDLLKAFPSQEDFILDNAMRSFDESIGGAASARSGRSKASSGATSLMTSSLGGSSKTPSDVASRASRQSGGADDAVNVNNVLAVARKKRQSTYHARLCWACAQGDYEKAKRLLSAACIDARVVDELGRTALHLAACGGNVKIVRYLIATGAEVNAEDKRGRAPLTDALLMEHDDVVKALKQAGAVQGRNVSHTCMCAPYEHLCKAVADADEQELKTLIAHENPVDASDPHKRVALHVAAAEGHVAMAELLMEKGADPNAEDEFGITPLHMSVNSRHDLCSDALVRHGAHFGAKFDQARHLCVAASEGDVDHLERLVKYRCDVNVKDDLGRTALHVAAASLTEPAVSFLLRVDGVRVNEENKWGETPLDEALRNEDSENPVIATLIRSVKGTQGSPKHATSANPALQVDCEAEMLEALKVTVAERRQLANRVQAVADWVHSEADAASRLKGVLEEAITLQRAKGSVLADEMPELWGEIWAFASESSTWYAETVRIVTPAMDVWARDTYAKAKPAMVKVHSILVDLARMHEENGAQALERLYQTNFRRPARASTDGHALFSSDNALSPSLLERDADGQMHARRHSSGGARAMKVDGVHGGGGESRLSKPSARPPISRNVA